MRIDKYLKVSRLIKRRVVAQEACSGGRVRVNGRLAKPGTEVRAGDTVAVEFGGRTVTVEVLDATGAAGRAGPAYKLVTEIKDGVSTSEGISSSDEHSYDEGGMAGGREGIRSREGSRNTRG